MNQSSYIAAFLLAGFVLFLAANNRLSAYTAVLWGTPQAPAMPAPSAGNVSPVQSPAPSTSPAPASSSGSIGDFGNAVSSVTSSIGKVLDTIATVGTLFGL